MLVLDVYDDGRFVEQFFFKSKGVKKRVNGRVFYINSPEFILQSYLRIRPTLQNHNITFAPANKIFPVKHSKRHVLTAERVLHNRNK